MRFKRFLNESEYINKYGYEHLKEDEFIDLAKKHCSEVFSHDTPFVARGIDMNLSGPEDIFGLSKPSTIERRSANTSNEYNLLLSNLPSWKKYPRRNKSNICTTAGNLEYAGNFGVIMTVLPFNGAKFGVCPKYDLWGSFKTLEDLYGDKDYTVSYLNHELTKLIEEAGIKLIHSNDSYEVLVSALDAATKYLQGPKLKIDKKYKLIYQDVINGSMTLLQFLEKILDPKVNGFRLTNYAGLKSISSGEHEVWTDSDCLMMSTEHFEDDDREFREFYQKIRQKVLSK